MHQILGAELIVLGVSKAQKKVPFVFFFLFWFLAKENLKPDTVSVTKIPQATVHGFVVLLQDIQ